MYKVKTFRAHFFPDQTVRISPHSKIMPVRAGSHGVSAIRGNLTLVCCVLIFGLTAGVFRQGGENLPSQVTNASLYLLS